MQKHAEMPLSIANGYPSEESPNDVITHIHAHVMYMCIMGGLVDGWIGVANH